jgi:hypothetical protein
MLGPNEGWAVGDNATILHYTVTGGVGTWNVVTVSGTPTISTDANLTSIFMLSPTAGWAVGGIQASGSFSAGPVILYWDGLKWTPVAVPSIPGGISPTGHSSATLKSVSCLSSNNCWAVGYPGKLFATILHWDGIAWTHVSTTPALIGQVPPILTSVYLFSIPGTSEDPGWIVGADPQFPHYVTPPASPSGAAFGTALSTILRSYYPAPATVTVVSTVTTTLAGCLVTTITSTLPNGSLTTYTTTLAGGGGATTVTSTSQITSIVTTNKTVGLPPPPSGSLVTVFVLLIVGLAAVFLLILFLLLARRRPRPVPVVYPVQRRPV